MGIRGTKWTAFPSLSALNQQENMVWTPPFSMDELSLNDKMGMLQVGIRFHTGADGFRFTNIKHHLLRYSCNDV